MNYDELIQIYTFNRFSDTSKALAALKEMEQLEEDEPSMQGRHFYYQAKFAYDNDHFSDALNYSLKGIHALINKPYLTELSRCYNIIGIIYSSKGDRMQALDYYLDALDMVEKHNDFQAACGIYNNIGCIYDDLSDISTAITYFKKALDALEDQDKEIKIMILINLALIYCEAEDWHQVEYYYQQVKEVQTNYETKANLIDLSVVKTIIAYHNDNIDEVKKELAIISEKGEHNELNINNFSEILNVLSKLIDVRLKNEILHLLRLMSKAININELFDAQTTMLEVCIELFKKCNDEKNLIQYTKLYYEVLKDKKKERSEILIEGANLKLQMRQMLREQQMIEEQSQMYQRRALRDELTGLYNRSLLKDKLENLFLQSQKAKLNIGILIIDINDFKQYNDYYGHIAGDRAIRELAKVMLRLCDDKIYFLRYGGDEFLGFFYGIDTANMRSLVQLVHSEIRALNIIHENTSSEQKVVSVTEGAYIGVPKESDTLYDYIAYADDQLYKGKRDQESLVIKIA